jgi:hypothetical protein
MTLAERLTTRPLWERRALVTISLAIAVVVLWTVIFDPLASLLVSQDDWRADARHQLAHSRGKANSEPALRKAVMALPSNPIWGKFLPARAGQDVSALIQRDVQTIGSTAGVTLQAMASLAKLEEGGLTGYGVRFTAAMTADQLRKFIGALRANPHYLRVERLTVNAPQLQRPDENPAFTITLEVFGYIEGPEVADAAPAATTPARGPL